MLSDVALLPPGAIIVILDGCAFDPGEFGFGFVWGKENGAFVGWAGSVGVGCVLGAEKAVGWPVCLLAFS